MSARAESRWGEEFELVVGLEVHVQLATATKLFCRCATDFGAPPNINTCPVCLALPGALPVLNDHAVDLAMRAALAIECDLNERSVFARKNYFYPDLPKGYQISQFDRPLAERGRVRIGSRPDGSAHFVAVTRVHLEEDAGKSIHDRFAGASAVDLNRSGVPLVEIVSEPELRAASEADAYLRALREILEYTGVSDVSMEKGSMRVDANVSARRHGDMTLGTKTEVKNMNSLSGVVRAIEAEFARQCAVLHAGGRIEQQTMLWDAATGTVRAARAKEGSDDYRYFPEPDLPPLVVTSERIARITRELPELPAARRDRLIRQHPDVAPYDIAHLSGTRAMGDYFEQLVAASGDAKTSANWMLGEVLAALNASQQTIDQLRVSPTALADLLHMVRDGIVTLGAAKQIFSAMTLSGDPAPQIAEREGLLKVGDDASLVRWIDEAFAEHTDEAARFVGGERRLQGVFVGYVIKKSKGSADPKRVNQLLAVRLGT